MAKAGQHLAWPWSGGACSGVNGTRPKLSLGSESHGHGLPKKTWMHAIVLAPSATWTPPGTGQSKPRKYELINPRDQL